MDAQSSFSTVIQARDHTGQRLEMVSSVSRSGDCQGDFRRGTGYAHVVHVGQKAYLIGDAALWVDVAKDDGLPSTRLRGLSGQWVDGPMAALSTFDAESMCDLSALVTNNTQDYGGTKTAGARTSINGTAVAEVTQHSNGSDTTLFVATQGPAYVLKAVQTGADPTTVVFGDFGKPVHPKAPSDPLFTG